MEKVFRGEEFLDSHPNKDNPVLMMQMNFRTGLN